MRTGRPPILERAMTSAERQRRRRERLERLRLPHDPRPRLEDFRVPVLEDVIVTHDVTP